MAALDVGLRGPSESVYWYVIDFMERETGIEPVTSSLGSWRSTAELLPLNFARLSSPLLQNNLPVTTLSVSASSAPQTWRVSSGKSSEQRSGKHLGKHWPGHSSGAQSASVLQPV